MFFEERMLNEIDNHKQILSAVSTDQIQWSNNEVHPTATSTDCAGTIDYKRGKTRVRPYSLTLSGPSCRYYRYRDMSISPICEM